MNVLDSLSKIKLSSNSQLAIYNKEEDRFYYCNRPKAEDSSVIYSTDNTFQINIPLLDTETKLQIVGYLSPIYSKDNIISITVSDYETHDTISKYNFPINLKRHNCIRIGTICYNKTMSRWVLDINSKYKKVSVITQMKELI